VLQKGQEITWFKVEIVTKKLEVFIAIEEIAN
jgi:hypothetical protein